MKRTIFLFSLTLCVSSAISQNLVSSTPAKLQVYFMKSDGSEVVLTNEKFAVTYNNLRMSGEAKVADFHTEDADLQALILETGLETIRFATVIPEGQFMFRDSYNNVFSTEAELTYGEHTERFMLHFDVSNRNTSLANSFTINCSGNFSMERELGITKDTGFNDKISFMFFQTVRALNY